MRKTLAITMLALGMFVFLLSAAFTVVQLTASETAWFEEEFAKLDLPQQMDMTPGDLGASIRTLISYLNGQTETIDVLVTINDQPIRMFDLDIEIIHMEEVRDLWQRCVALRNVGVLVAMIFALLGVVMEGRDALRNACMGYFWALGAFLVLVAFAGTWAAINFDSFWTFFHRIIFPTSENWLLPANSRMIQMLPSELFHDLVVRMGGRMLLLFLPVAGISALVLVLQQRKQRVVDPWAAKAKRTKTPKEQLAEIQGPDLLAVHKKANMSVTERRKLIEAQEKEKQALAAPDEGEEADFRDAALDTPVESREKFAFAPAAKEDARKFEEDDDDYDELL